MEDQHEIAKWQTPCFQDMASKKDKSFIFMFLEKQTEKWKVPHVKPTKKYSGVLFLSIKSG